MHVLKRPCVLIEELEIPSLWGRKHDQNAKVIYKAGLLPKNILISSSHKTD